MASAALTALLAAAFALVPQAALAATLDGASLSIVWALPFAGILLSIALGPLGFRHIWEHHYGKISALWALSVTVPLILAFGISAALQSVLHVLLHEYLPFILMLLALFTAAGGILVSGNLHGSPLTNTALLAIGTTLASVIGTTGASMVMIRPVIRANDNRRHNVHVVVFFIFLVSNIGGSLTPLGDPPLFLGFLRGIDFFWTTTHLLQETLFLTGMLLAIFFALDSWMYRRDPPVPGRDPTPDDARVRVSGGINVVLIVVIVAAIVTSGTWRPDVAFNVLGVEVELQNLVREATMVAVALASLVLTPREHRAENGFSWEPIKEVAKLFAGIFVCIIPVLAMLDAGSRGVFAPVVALVSGPDGTPDNVAYFWLTGLLSSFLDNAPTYLVFFEMAGGEPDRLMGPLASTLAAISMGAVFMGANTYIGNAPNFMVYAIARDMNVKMPTFFGYMAWSAAILGPLFILLTLIFIP
ncbi:MAG TPA: sodium:proton antiporter [Beijerinckiaceae bacterium]|nr:sodium:proton antiporter [Beijerinckiaceae bacterium]